MSGLFKSIQGLQNVSHNFRLYLYSESLYVPIVDCKNIGISFGNLHEVYIVLNFMKP